MSDFKEGDVVTIKREALHGDNAAFPHGTVIRYVGPTILEIELMYMEELVQVDEKFVSLKKKK